MLRCMTSPFRVPCALIIFVLTTAASHIGPGTGTAQPSQTPPAATSKRSPHRLPARTRSAKHGFQPPQSPPTAPLSHGQARIPQDREPISTQHRQPPTRHGTKSRTKSSPHHPAQPTAETRGQTWSPDGNSLGLFLPDCTHLRQARTAGESVTIAAISLCRKQFQIPSRTQVQ